MSTHSILYNLRAFWLKISSPIRKTYTANVCQHKTKKTGVVEHKGKSYTMGMPLSENGNPDYCLECIAKMEIQCAWCGEPIRIGNPVTLYVPKESFEIPEYAVRYDADERCLVGCLGWDCADGCDRQGFWMPPGKVMRVPSPIEMILSAEGEDVGKAIIIGDLSDPKDMGRFV